MSDDYSGASKWVNRRWMDNPAGLRWWWRCDGSSLWRSMTKFPLPYFGRRHPLVIATSESPTLCATVNITRRYPRGHLPFSGPIRAQLIAAKSAKAKGLLFFRRLPLSSPAPNARSPPLYLRGRDHPAGRGGRLREWPADTSLNGSKFYMRLGPPFGNCLKAMSAPIPLFIRFFAKRGLASDRSGHAPEDTDASAAPGLPRKRNESLQPGGACRRGRPSRPGRWDSWSREVGRDPDISPP